MLTKAAFVFIVPFLITTASMADAALQPLGKDSQRILFIGDSITGQSRNHPAGYARQFEWAWNEAHPGSKPQIISLGGSGQSVGGWLGVEKNSREKSFNLDIKDVPVKENLDQKADAMIVMLGMNDVLAPYVSGSDASLDKWEDDYKQLIENLKSRCSPELLCIGSITPCTEDPESPKNKLIARMNERGAKLAAELGGRFIPCGQTV